MQKADMIWNGNDLFLADKLKNLYFEQTNTTRLLAMNDELW
jgi:hypothetical protein